jgi:hypothetical protein
MQSSDREKEVRRLTDVLRSRLRRRVINVATTVFFLELRNAECGFRGQPTMRHKTHPDWPKKGKAVETEAEAKALLPSYAEWLHDKPAGEPRTRGSAGVLTWNEAVPAFLEALKESKGEDSRTYQAYRTSLRKHVLPRFGNHPLTLDSVQVGMFLDSLHVTRQYNGLARQAPAAPNTKRAVRDAMRACFGHHFRHRKPTFSGVEIKEIDSEAHQRRTRAAERGIVQSLGTAFGPNRLFRVMEQAAVNDYLGITIKPNVRYAIANTPDAIAWQVATLTRIAELMRIRWNGYEESDVGELVPMVDLERCGGVVYVPGTKTGHSPRWVVLWEAFRPWVRRMGALSLSSDDGVGYVFQVPGRDSNLAPPEKTYSSRMVRAQKSARLKRQQKATHLFRATGATYLATRLPEEKVKLLLGHSTRQSFTGATGLYMDPEVLLRELPRDIWTYMNGLLPHPDSVFSAASEELKRRGFDVDLTTFPGLRLVS